VVAPEVNIGRVWPVRLAKAHNQAEVMPWSIVPQLWIDIASDVEIGAMLE
jgi:hypothetical protein